MIRPAPFFVLLLFYQLIIYVQGQTGSSLDAPSSCVNGHCSKRTLFDIIEGCLTTTLICAWTAVHPNMPPRQGIVKGFLRRVGLLFCAIIAPEFLPCWALNQLLAAVTARNVYNRAKGYAEENRSTWRAAKRPVEGDSSAKVWTAWHGYFLVMGGFHLIEPPTENLTERASGTLPAENKSLDDDGPTILTLELLRRLVDDPEFELHISQDEIKDKSKGNALSKFIFILQTSWFIAQCIGRHVQGLELSQLELTTLALASLNGITILLWWKKPLGAQTPVRVYLRKRLDLQREGSIFHGCGTDLSLTSGSRSRLILLILGAPFYSILWCVNNFGLFRLIVGVILLPLSIGILLPLSVIFVFALTIFWAVTDLLVPAEFPVDNHATHVPTFYTPKHEYSEYWPFFLLALLGVVFGGIHCAGWNFPFPTYTYQLLWRISSLTISLIPICGPAVILIILIFRNLVKTFVGSATFELPRLYEIVTTSQVLTAFFGFLYAVVRLVLLGLALALLRNQPLSVFIALDWTKYYPHL